MQVKKVLLASDHGGVKLKNHLAQWLEKQGYEIQDFGPSDDVTSVDYPDKALELIKSMRITKDCCGILVCTTGIGMSIAANRFDFIRGALVQNVDMAKMCRSHNDANVLIFGAKYMGNKLAEQCTKTFLTTEFEGGRHARRVTKLTCIGDKI